MPDVTVVVIAVGAWMALALLATALCTAAGRADRARRLFGVEDERSSGGAGPPVVVDTGGLRTRLREATAEIDADQLAVVVHVSGSDAILATSRPLLPAEPGTWQSFRVPIRRNGIEVAMLQAHRRPGAPAFDAADRRALEILAGRLGDTVLPPDLDTSRPRRIRRVIA